MKNPNFLAEFMESPMAKNAQAHGIDLGLTGEPFQSAVMKSMVGAPLRPFQRAFETFLAVGRAHLFDGFARGAVNSGLKGKELQEELFRLARFTDTMMGTTTSRGLGVSAGQRQFENGWAFFSPRYTRGLFGLAASVFAKGRVGHEGRRAVAQLLAGGAATYYAIGKAFGKDDEELIRGLNPMSGKRFLSYEINGRWYGIGGGARSLMMLLAASADEENWKFIDEEGGLGGGYAFNFVKKWLRMRQPPAASLLSDIISKETPMGVPMSAFFTDIDPVSGKKTYRPTKELGKYVAGQFLPFSAMAWAEMYGEGAGILEQAIGTGFEFHGIRTSPTTFTDIADEEARKLGMGSYSEAEDYQKTEIEAMNRAEEAKGKRKRYGAGGELDSVERRLDKKMENLENRAITATTTGLNRTDVAREIMSDFWDAMQVAAVDRRSIRRGEWGPSAGRDENNKALTKYYDLVHNVKVATGERSKDKQRQDEYLEIISRSNPDIYKFILRQLYQDRLDEDKYPVLAELMRYGQTASGADRKRLSDEAREEHRRSLR
jgi:hypothetical protein